MLPSFRYHTSRIKAFLVIHSCVTLHHIVCSEVSRYHRHCCFPFFLLYFWLPRRVVVINDNKYTYRYAIHTSKYTQPSLYRAPFWRRCHGKHGTHVHRKAYAWSRARGRMYMHNVDVCLYVCLYACMYACTCVRFTLHSE